MRADKNYKPMLPLWLSPTQVRIIPVSQEYLGFAESIVDQFSSVRVDIDNREETVGKKIREAEKEWIPYIIVVGEKEAGREKFPVRVRSEGKQVEMSVSDLQETVDGITGDMPYRPLPMPLYLQDRPKFVG